MGIRGMGDDPSTGCLACRGVVWGCLEDFGSGLMNVSLRQWRVPSESVVFDGGNETHAKIAGIVRK
eukprot:268528-Amorphochlora_amoeboformis.AAC.1